QGAFCQPQLYDDDQGAEPARKRRTARNAVPALRDAGVPVPFSLAAEFGRILGQSVRPAPCNVGLFPAAPARISGHDQRRPAVLSRLAPFGTPGSPARRSRNSRLGTLLQVLREERGCVGPQFLCRGFAIARPIVGEKGVASVFVDLGRHVLTGRLPPLFQLG